MRKLLMSFSVITLMVMLSLIVDNRQAHSHRDGERSHRHYKGGHYPPGYLGFFIRHKEELKLSQRQLNAIKDISKEHRQKHGERRKKMRSISRMFFAEMRKGQPNRDELTKLYKQRSEIKLASLLAYLDFRSAVNKVLSAKQRIELKKLISAGAHRHHRHGKHHHSHHKGHKFKHGQCPHHKKHGHGGCPHHKKSGNHKKCSCHSGKNI